MSKTLDNKLKPRFNDPPTYKNALRGGNTKCYHEYIFHVKGRYGCCKKCGCELLT